MNDFANIPRHETYCPDLSDMRDELFGFWDFLSEKPEPEKDDKCNDTNTSEIELWDFIGSSGNCSQIESQLKTINHIVKKSDCISRNSISDESEPPRLDYDLNNTNTVYGNNSIIDICPKPPDKADDDFWDFLKCNSPIKDYQEVFETPSNCSSTFNPSTGDSAFQSHVSIPSSVSSIKDYNSFKQNVQLRNQSEGVKAKKHQRTSEANQTKTTCNRVGAIQSVGGIYNTSTPKSPRIANVKKSGQGNFKFPKDKASKLTDDEFWDFLSCDSPVVQYSDALRELPCPVNKDTSMLTDSGISIPSKSSYFEESPFSFVSNAAESGRQSVESNAATHISISAAQHLVNERLVKDNIKMNTIKNAANRYNRSNRPENTTKSTSSEYISKSVSISSQNKAIKSKTLREKNAYSSVYTTSQNEILLSDASKSSKNLNTKLPCISSVFSVSVYPDWLTGPTQLANATCSQPTNTNEKRQKPVTIVSDNRIQGKKFHADEIRECSKRNRPSLTPVSPIGCSQFKVIDADDFPSSKIKGTGNDNLNIPNNKAASNSLSSDINVVQFKQNPPTMQTCTSTTGSVPENSIINGATNSSKNLYLVLPQNQNYSHFLVLLNNTADLAKPPSDKNSTMSSEKNIRSVSTCDPVNTGLKNQKKSNSLLKVPLNNLQIQSANSNYNAVLHSEGSNVGKQTVLHKNSIQRETITASNKINCSANGQLLKNFITMSNITNLSANNNILLSLNDASTTKSVSNTAVSNQKVETDKMHQNIQIPLNILNAKTIPPKTLPIIKPIKSISLGRDKNAILQTSIPLKMENISENKHLCDAQGNVINYFYDSNISNSFPQNFFSSYDITETLNDQGRKDEGHKTKMQIPTQANASNRESIKINDLVNEAISEIGNSSNAETDVQLKNASDIDQSRKYINTNNISLLNENKSSISEKELLNNNTSSSISYKQDTSNSNISAVCSNQNQTNNYVQIKVAPAQTNTKSLSNLQELFPPPISMVPVCVAPKAQAIIQPTAPKVLVLKGLGEQQQILWQNSQPKPDISTHQPTSDKKSAVKPKKTGRKTVRELLEERQKNILKQSGYHLRKDLKILRPIQKIPTSSTFYPTILPNNKSTTVSYSGMTGSSTSSFPSQQTDFSKRPNILMLPSACKVMKKNIIKDESNSLLKMKDQGILDHSPEYEISQQEHLSFRPRHYDMSELQIGYFKVDDDMDSCGRFRSKFKVIFSKRQFLYEFPVCRCNQVDLKSSEIWEQMVRIVVPFKILTSMDLSDRTIHLHINCTPQICLGRLQARSGIISNATVYDTPVESDSSWGNAIRSSFIHKVVLRKRQVNKLKTFLYQFDETFISLTNNRAQSGIYGSNSFLEGELSPTTLKKSFTKNKKSGIRRLPQWDSPEYEGEKLDDEIEMLKPQMCSCRISCRSVRCSCAKAAKSCSSICICINCGNPLNVLESIGIDIELALKDRCLFQNIYRIPNLLDFLLREIKLSCCNTFSRVQHCIPGTVLCPNIDCNVQLEFSWCRVIVCYPERNPRNHCSLCGQCCFSNGRHCMTCNRCYVKTSSKLPHCPTCQEKTTTCDTNFNPNSTNYQFPPAKDLASFTKLSTKPEIILLDAYSIPKDSISFENMEGVIETERGDIEVDTAEGIQDEMSDVFITEQMDFTVEED